MRAHQDNGGDGERSSKTTNLQSYLDEFSFLYNIRHLSVLERFNLLLSLCCQTTTSALDLKQHSIRKDVPHQDLKGRISMRNRLASKIRIHLSFETKKIDFSYYL